MKNGPTTLALIAAVARNGVIGRDQKLPWHLPADLAHFRRVTHGHPVLMGRRTWESLPERFRPLPGRRNLVLSNQAGWKAPGAEVFPDLSVALAALQGVDKAFVIGGHSLYQAALPWADELILTEIGQDVPGDTFFPPWDRDRFIERSRVQPVPEQLASNDPPFSFVIYQRF